MSIKPLIYLFSAASIAAASLPGAQAMPIAYMAASQDHTGLTTPGSGLVEQVYWRRGWRWGWVGAAGAATDGVVGEIERE